MKVSQQHSNIAKKHPKLGRNYQAVPKPYLDFAKGQERIFTNHLLKEMRKTIHKTQEDSSAQKYYQSIMDDEISRIMSDSDSGIGIKDTVLEQIYPQYKRLNQSPQQAYNMNNPKQGVHNE